MNKDNDSFEEFVSKQNDKHQQKLAQKVWRGSPTQSNIDPRHVISTGHQALNEILHSKGWPLGVSTEIGLSEYGIGELRLLLPALKALQERSQSTKSADSASHILWVAPPLTPFAPALIKEGLDTKRLTVIQTRNVQDTLWTCEQALLSGCCSAVICWTGSYNLNNKELRRLQLATEKNKCWNVIFRHSSCMTQASISSLRIQLQSTTRSQLSVLVNKQPNSWGGQTCTLSLHPHYENWQRLPVGLLPHPQRNNGNNTQANIGLVSDNKHRTSTVTLLSSLATLQTVH